MSQDAEIVSADFDLDGGSTTVMIKRENRVIFVHLDYSLPWDGRSRRITMRENESERKLQLGSSEEKDICEAIRSALNREFGVEAVDSALRSMSERELDRAKRQPRQDESAIQDNIEISVPELAPLLSSSGAAFLFVHRAIAEGKISI